MSTDSVRLERRSGQRFQLNLPLTIHVDGRSVAGYAQDVSSRGIFLFAEVSVAPGAIVELTFTMPSEITLGESMRVRARGRVLRTEPSVSRNASGMAVLLESYEYLAEAASEASAELARVSTGGPAHDSVGVTPH